VGHPGNAADDGAIRGQCGPDATYLCGSVATAYRISKTEVTNAQYVEFLNAVDPNGTNPYQIYSASMGTLPYGGIDFIAGNDAGTKYQAKAGRGAIPVKYVTFWDSLRFANWLNNGQGSADTETGAYTLLGGTEIPSNANSVTRNAGATIVLPSEDEWYKAAYFNGTSYFDYPTGTDTQIVCAAPGTTANTANCDFAVGNLTIVGSYTASPSPYGTFDQGGNSWEWTETLSGGSDRISRGGSFSNDPTYLSASVRSISDPDSETNGNTIRLASPIPEPGTAVLLATALLALAAARRRRSFH
jgi:formylglycine-generating enzyme required for sulfatase activity